jgi:hypothetical protein
MANRAPLRIMNSIIGSLADDLADDVSGRAASAEGGSPAEDTWRPRARTLGALLADPALTEPPRWVLPPLVQSGEVALVSAPPKTGKSHLVSQLAAQLSIGGTALDGAPLAAGVVLWLGFDEPLRRLAPRLEALGAHPERVRVVEREPGHLLTANHLAALITEHRPVLVVLDTTSQLALDHGVDMNDGAQVGPFLRSLIDAVRAAASPETPCAGLFIHHAPHHTSRAAGSLQWGAIVDATLVLRRPRRNTDPRAPEADDLDDDVGDDGARILEGVTRAGGPLKLRLTFSGGRYAQADAPSPLIDRVRTLLVQLDCGPGVSSAAKMRDHLRCRDAALQDVLAELQRRGELRAVGKPRSPGFHYMPTASMSLYPHAVHPVQEHAERGGADVDRSRDEPEGEAPSLTDATSSRLHGYMPAVGKKMKEPPAGAELPPDTLSTTTSRVLPLFGEDAEAAA